MLLPAFMAEEVRRQGKKRLRLSGLAKPFAKEPRVAVLQYYDVAPRVGQKPKQEREGISSFFDKMYSCFGQVANGENLPFPGCLSI
jgi:hypothetical protein